MWTSSLVMIVINLSDGILRTETECNMERTESLLDNESSYSNYSIIYYFIQTISVVHIIVKCTKFSVYNILYHVNYVFYC